MKISIRQILQLQQTKSLAKLLKQDIPSEDAISLYTLVKQFEDALKYFENKRVELVAEYGDPQDGTDEFTIKDEKKLEQFNKEINKVLDEQIETDFEPIDAEKFEDVKISVDDLETLSSVILKF